jgi:uncharacterized protein YjbI with pentapeptide repeats
VRSAGGRDVPGRRPVAEPNLPAGLEAADVDDLDHDVRLDEVAIGPGSAAGRTIEGLTLKRSTLAGVRLTGSTFQGLELVDVVVEDCDLAGVTFAETTFRRVSIRRCRMSGVVAADLAATDSRIVDTRADEIWLRAARLDHCEIVDCDLTGSDWYAARVMESFITGSRLDGAELSAIDLENVVVLGSTFAGAQGLSSLRNVTIGTGQLLEIGLPVLAGLGIVIDDAALDPDDPDDDAD